MIELDERYPGSMDPRNWPRNYQSIATKTRHDYDDDLKHSDTKKESKCLSVKFGSDFTPYFGDFREPSYEKKSLIKQAELKIYRKGFSFDLWF